MKSVFKRLISAFVSLSLCASVIAGALCLNVKKASATMASSEGDFADIVEMFSDNQYQHKNIILSQVEEILQYGTWPENFSHQAYRPFIFVLTDGNGNSFCGIYGSNLSDALGYYKPGSGRSYYVARGDIGSTSGVYCYAWIKTYNGNSSGKSDIYTQAYGSSSWSFSSNSFPWFNQDNTTLTQYTCYLSCNIYTGNHATNIETPLNLVYSSVPVSAYDNMIVPFNDHIYFTTSDNSVIRDMAADGDGYFELTLSYGEMGEYTFIIYADNFQYLPYTVYPGVSNISPNGLLGYDITGASSSIQARSLLSSVGFPESKFPNYFSYVQVDIGYNSVNEAWQQYYDYLNELLDLVGSESVVSPNSPPSYISHQLYTSQKSIPVSGGSNSDAGCIVLNEIPDVPYDHILVCSTALFDDYSASFTLLSASTSNAEFINFLSPYLLQQIDMIVVLPEAAFESVLQGQPDHPDNFVNWNPYSWNIGVVTGPHGYFYYTSAVVRSTNINDVEGYAFVTERYLQKCNNWILSDGIKSLYSGLNDITTNQGTIVSAIINGAGSIYTSIEKMGLDDTNIPYLSKIYNLLFSLNLSDKLDKLLDKLDTLIDNTNVDGEENTFWISPLYWFIKLFEPDTNDYVSSISEITDTWESLPAIPSVTPVAIPTIQFYLPGD